MKGNINKISAEVKSEVLLELAKAECGVGNISRRYGISRATIYSWLKEGRAGSGCGGVSSVTSINEQKKFVELAVVEGSDHFGLTKASLVFEDFSLSVEGKLSISKVISILKTLEVTC